MEFTVSENLKSAIHYMDRAIISREDSCTGSPGLSARYEEASRIDRKFAEAHLMQAHWLADTSILSDAYNSKYGANLSKEIKSAASKVRRMPQPRMFIFADNPSADDPATHARDQIQEILDRCAALNIAEE